MSRPEGPGDWKSLARDGDHAGAVAEYIRATGGVSFTELHRQFSPFFDTRGDMALVHSEYENVIYWAGMSGGFFGIMLDLIRSGRVHMHPTELLVYLVDGGVLGMPLVKRARSYKTPHWFPVSLYSYPVKPRPKSRPKAIRTPKQ